MNFAIVATFILEKSVKDLRKKRIKNFFFLFGESMALTFEVEDRFFPFLRHTAPIKAVRRNAEIFRMPTKSTEAHKSGTSALYCQPFKR